MSAEKRETCEGCGHHRIAHGTTTGDACYDDCGCERFLDEPRGAGRDPDYYAVTPQERYERAWREKHGR